MFSLVQQFEASVLLLAALFLGAAVGAERERRDKSAGLRTHILVSIGAALLGIISRYGFESGDPGRVAASAISGISFLGAGVIIVRQDRVHDLTTAASIWITAAIGLSVGTGAWLLGILTTLLTWFTLFVLRRFEYHVYGTKEPLEKDKDNGQREREEI
jgi:putative Mg2+ transporter-C (MgtC) family protein